MMMSKRKAAGYVLGVLTGLSLLGCGYTGEDKLQSVNQINEQQEELQNTQEEMTVTQSIDTEKQKMMAEGITESQTEEQSENMTQLSQNTDDNVVDIMGFDINIYCPKSLNVRTADTEYGELVRTSYYSKTCEKERKVNILLPAGYTEDKKYPVLYILHGIFGDQNSMVGDGKNGIPALLGNMIDQKLAEEMIVVFPYMYASKTQEACTAIDVKNIEAYDNFINDLVDDLMPFMKENYSVADGKDNTAVAGFSMGGREALAIGLQRPDLFGYICGIAPAPGLVPGKDWAMEHPGQFTEEQLVYDKEAPYFTMVCCGDSDKTVGTFPKSYHEIYDKNNVDHIWWEIPESDHGDPAISSGIYNFARFIFK